MSGSAVATACVWSAYLLVPVDGWGLFHGRPMGLLSITALAAVWWLALARGSRGGIRLIAVALLLKVVAGALLLVPHGFNSRYYANEHFTGPIERSTDRADASFTRIDDRLRFGGGLDPNDRDLPLDFFNDLRFNYYRASEPDRERLPFSVIWQGFWYIPTAGSQPLYVRSPSGDTQISIDDTFRVRVPATARWTGVAGLSAGFHRMTISLQVPQGGRRQFEAGRLVDGRDEPFDHRVIFRRQAGASALMADRLTRYVSTALDTLLCVWFMVLVAIGMTSALRELRASYTVRNALALAWAMAIADAVIFAAPAVGRMITLSGGNDWLGYEAEARDIGLNGLLMTAGAALGHGHPFYTQPLYPYFLAACHWLSGPTLAGVYFAQRLLAAATVIALWRTVAAMFDEPTGLAALLTAFVVVYAKFTPWSDVLLTETLFVPLVCCWVYAVVRLARAPTPSARLALIAGVLGGLATLTRQSLLLGWCTTIPALVIVSGRSTRRWAMVALMLATMIGVISLATLRNWIVAHEFVPIASEGSVVLFLGNPPPDLKIPPEHAAQYTRWGLDQYARAVAEFARQQPRAFLTGLGRKALYTLGLFDTLTPGAGTSAFYVAIWIAAGIGLVCWTLVGPNAPLAIVAIPLGVAATHFAVDVVFLPNVYGDRMLLLFYVTLVPCAALAVLTAGRTISRAGPATVRSLVWLAALLACGVEAWRPGAVGFDVAFVLPLMLAASLALGEPWRGRRGLALFAVMAACLTVTFVLAPSADAAVEYRRQLGFLALAPVAAPLAVSKQTRRVAVGLLLAMAAAALVNAVVNRGDGGFGRLDDTLALSAWAREAGSVRLLDGHWWFGRGLALPQLPTLHGTTLATGGLMLWVLVSAGVVGAVSYLAVWLRALWVTVGRFDDWTWPVLHGMLLSAFAVAQSRNVLGGQGTIPAALALLGLTFGLIESATYVSASVRVANRS